MIIGAAREICPDDRRVAMVPMLVPSLTKAGHYVVIEQDAALTSGYLNDEYLKAGAKIEQNRSRLFEQSEIKIRLWKGGFKITPEGFNFEIRNNIKYATG
jgi:alanine dehydrogenase